MIKFIKKLLGLTEPVISTAPYKLEAPDANLIPQAVARGVNLVDTVVKTEYVPPAKPINKVRAVGESGAKAVAAATTPIPANKKRRPYKGNKPKANPVVTNGTTPANVKVPKK